LYEIQNNDVGKVTVWCK